MSRPLADLTVVSIEQAVAAPFATRQLADLGMPHGRFAIDIGAPEPAPGPPFTRSGIDRVEFLFSANPGQPPGRLSQIAS